MIANYLPALGRLLLSSVFIWSGYDKLTDPSGTAREFVDAGVPVPNLAVWIAIIVELGAGLAVLAGVKARLAALILAVWSLLTGFAVHLAAATTAADAMVAYDNMIHFYKNLGLAGGFLYITAFGAGQLSVDHGWGKLRRLS